LSRASYAWSRRSGIPEKAAQGDAAPHCTPLKYVNQKARHGRVLINYGVECMG